MGYTNTLLSFLREDCAGEFGEAKGGALYAAACERLAAMLETADFRGNESIRFHIEKNMYPTIAYYLTLRGDGFSEGDAYALTLKETRKAAAAQKKKNESFAKLPFAYAIFKSSVGAVMKRMYPAEGWETEWVRRDGEEIHINFKRCIYLELTTRFGCPELCTVFCKNDDVVFAGYEPKIYFRRSGTLAEGAGCCDFHFLRGRPSGREEAPHTVPRLK